MNRTLKLLAIGFTLVSLTGCLGTQTTKQGVVGIERQQLMMISEQEMTQGAQKAYKAILKEARNKKTQQPRTRLFPL